MLAELPSSFAFSSEVARALKLGLPVVALESTVITHGLPRPQNLSLAEEMESQVRSEGAVPATVAVLEGCVKLGMSAVELDQLALAIDPVKVSRRDFSNAIWGGLTVRIKVPDVPARCNPQKTPLRLPVATQQSSQRTRVGIGTLQRSM